MSLACNLYANIYKQLSRTDSLSDIICQRRKQSVYSIDLINGNNQSKAKQSSASTPSQALELPLKVVDLWLPNKKKAKKHSQKLT